MAGRWSPQMDGMGGHACTSYVLDNTSTLMHAMSLRNVYMRVYMHAHLAGRNLDVREVARVLDGCKAQPCVGEGEDAARRIQLPHLLWARMDGWHGVRGTRARVLHT